jgi:uncharacterized damage-inducible protein DinB
MAHNPHVQLLARTKDFFDRSTSCLQESDSQFTPKDGMYSVAAQVAHVAQTIDWFTRGGLEGQKWDLDFVAHDAEVREVTSLQEARAWLDRAVANAIAIMEKMTPEDMQQKLPEGPIMGGAPRMAVVGAMCEHTAHHRGALAVYTRLLGKTPPMPYAS